VKTRKACLRCISLSRRIFERGGAGPNAGGAEKITLGGNKVRKTKKKLPTHGGGDFGSYEYRKGVTGNGRYTTTHHQKKKNEGNLTDEEAPTGKKGLK